MMGALSPAERRLHEVTFGATARTALRTTLKAWGAAERLSTAAFRDRFLGLHASDETVERLRTVARDVAGARTQTDLRAAGEELAGVVRRIGLERWPGFLRAAADRAAAAPRLLAQVAPTTTRSDASGDKKPDNGEARYGTQDPSPWMTGRMIGDGQCVAFVRAATGAPSTADWSAGPLVQGNTSLPRYTAIAVFDKDGHYGNHTDGTSHTALIVSQNKKGMYVIDQWKKGSHFPQGRFILWHNPGSSSPIENGENYRVVQ